jgi:hypothetical protein
LGHRAGGQGSEPNSWVPGKEPEEVDAIGQGISSRGGPLLGELHLDPDQRLIEDLQVQDAIPRDGDYRGTDGTEVPVAVSGLSLATWAPHEEGKSLGPANQRPEGIDQTVVLVQGGADAPRGVCAAPAQKKARSSGQTVQPLSNGPGLHREHGKLCLAARRACGPALDVLPIPAKHGFEESVHPVHQLPVRLKRFHDFSSRQVHPWSVARGQ